MKRFSRLTTCVVVLLGAALLFASPGKAIGLFVLGSTHACGSPALQQDDAGQTQPTDCCDLMSSSDGEPGQPDAPSAPGPRPCDPCDGPCDCPCCLKTVPPTPMITGLIGPMHPLDSPGQLVAHPDARPERLSLGVAVQPPIL